jgi:S1-C subfamily serine protease
MVAALVGLVLGIATSPAGAQVPSTVRRALQEATVAVEPAGCVGVVAESRQLVLTARHCLDEGTRSVRVRLSNGEERTAWVVGTDRVADQAALFLEEPVEVKPLAVTRRRQLEGTVLYFEGHPKRPRFQAVRLDRVGQCPSLPNLPNALFTTIKGQPGDSGAPVVDGLGRVVGLVHGGSTCQIATPADTLGRLIDRVLQRQLV